MARVRVHDTVVEGFNSFLQRHVDLELSVIDILVQMLSKETGYVSSCDFNV